MISSSRSVSRGVLKKMLTQEGVIRRRYYKKVFRKDGANLYESTLEEVLQSKAT